MMELLELSENFKVNTQCFEGEICRGGVLVLPTPPISVELLELMDLYTYLRKKNQSPMFGCIG